MVDPPILSLILARTVYRGGVPIAKVRGHLIITAVAMATEQEVVVSCGRGHGCGGPTEA